MVTRNYNIFVSEKSSEDCYIQFIKKYEKNLRRIGHGQQIYDLNDSAVIINLIDEKEINKKQTNNLTLIGKEKNIDKTIQEIKQKGFSLEKIAN